MNLSREDLQSLSKRASFRPLRRQWMFAWVLLCAVGAVKLTMELLGLQTELLMGWHMAIAVSLFIVLLAWLF